MIFVTGGSGLVGSHLLYKLCCEGKQVRALLRSKESIEGIREVFSFYSENVEQLLSTIDWVFGNIVSYESLLENLCDVREVYHCAAKVSFNPKDKPEIFKTNIIGTRNIVNSCLEQKVGKLIYVSSVASIGSGGQAGKELTEEYFPEDKRSNYSYSKTKAEFEVWRGIEEGLSAVIVNPSVILGPGYWKKGSSKIFNQAQKGLKFYTKGGTGFVGVWDVVDAMLFLNEKGIEGERYIINSENLLYKDLFRTIARCLDKKPPKFLASPLLTALFWRLAYILSFISRTEPLLTKESAQSSNRISTFSSKKIQQLGFNFEPIDKVVEKVCGYLVRKS